MFLGMSKCSDSFSISRLSGICIVGGMSSTGRCAPITLEISREIAVFPAPTANGATSPRISIAQCKARFWTGFNCIVPFGVRSLGVRSSGPPGSQSASIRV